LFAGLTTLPAREGASVALSLLKEQGIELIAFTNSSATAAKAQLKSGHLDAFMSEIVSTGEVKAFKPSKSVYLHCAEQAGVEPGELMLVAAHPWDIHGASEAGLSTAYLSSQRPMTPVMHQPQLEAADPRDLAEQICQLSYSPAARPSDPVRSWPGPPQRRPPSRAGCRPMPVADAPAGD
jgi:2-haloacid dehalogenase